MKKIGFIAFLFCGVFVLRAQEVDYNRLASIFNKESNENFISKLKQVAKSESGLKLLKELLDLGGNKKAPKKVPNAPFLISKNNDKIEKLEEERKKNVDEYKSIRRKLKNLNSDINHYERKASEAKSASRKFSSLGYGEKYRKEYNNYVKLYNSALKKYNYYVKYGDGSDENITRIKEKENNLNTEINRLYLKIDNLKNPKPVVYGKGGLLSSLRRNKVKSIILARIKANNY